MKEPAVKNTSDMLRHSIGTEEALEAVEAENLPELVLREISGAEALRMTRDSPELVAGTDESGEHAVAEADGTEDKDDRVEEEADVACS